LGTNTVWAAEEAWHGTQKRQKDKNQRQAQGNGECNQKLPNHALTKTKGHQKKHGKAGRVGKRKRKRKGRNLRMRGGATVKGFNYKEERLLLTFNGPVPFLGIQPERYLKWWSQPVSLRNWGGTASPI